MDRRVLSPTLIYALLWFPAWLGAQPGPAPLSVSYRTTADWGSGFNGEITLRNDTGTALADWSVEMVFDRDITTIWDARIARRDGARYVIRAMEYNKVIEPGRSVTFGFGGSPGNVMTGPREISAAAGGETVDSGSRVRVTLAERVRTNSGYQAELTIENPGEKVTGWELALAGTLELQGARGIVVEQRGGATVLRGEDTIEGRGSLRVQVDGIGRLTAGAVTGCRFNNRDCVAQVFVLSAPVLPAGPVLLDFDTNGAETQITVAQGVSRFAFRNPGSYLALSNNPGVAAVSVEGGTLVVTAGAAGRAALRLTEQGGAVRWLGVRVKQVDGSLPEMPGYLSLGAMSEDTGEHLQFWRGFEAGARNRRSDIRYIYLNGGPYNGWDTWGASPGSRAVNYIRNSRMLGIVPFFVFYNIPDGSESYELDLAHVQDPTYMAAYFRNLKLFLDIVRRESPDELVGMVLEPDFLGYLAQNAGKPASEIRAVTRMAYETGVLDGSDPRFPDTVQGLVQAINRSISKHAPQVYFGWQMNLWASPAGGFTTPVPGRGIIRLTDDLGIERGRAALRREAAAITQYYLDAGIGSYGARFVSIDKYGLDAVGLESGAAQNPAGSIWFWNNDHWNNYLAFVEVMRSTSGLPVILWQLPVGRINRTQQENPYVSSGRFEDLTNAHQRYEDSAPVFFLGDTFTTTGTRRDYFATNRGEDAALQVDGDTITWGSHMRQAADAGVVSILFGAGVGASTSSIGDPPTDGFWWITKAQRYYERPVPLR